ncbi:MAG: AAA family ATPase [Nitrospirota bacterium]|jgi:MoxR-like ATPase
MHAELAAVTERIAEESRFLGHLRAEIGRVVVGQEPMVDSLLIGLLCGGHVLLEGVPGLAKTRTVNALADAVGGHFKRIQFTPDLLPADLVGTLIFNPKSGEFTARKGPIFANIVLADEINRAPAKVQSALLEAMQERQVTIGDATYRLEEPFLVLATQNPIEQEGTYPLPEAQVDRFMLKVVIDYPSPDEERRIIEMVVADRTDWVQPATTLQEVLSARRVVREVYVDAKINDYILALVGASRHPAAAQLDDLAGLIEYGASPRASIYLNLAARAHAFLHHRGYVIPEDIKAVGREVLRHRILPTYEAQAEGLSSEAIVGRLFDGVAVP